MVYNGFSMKKENAAEQAPAAAFTVMKKKEFIMIGAILFAALVLFLVRNFSGTDDCMSIRITIAGQVYGEYSLLQDRVIDINGTNTCEIKNGEARMTDASCPDHYCMEQAPIGRNGGTIICLPNKIIIEGVSASGGSDPEVDAVT